MKTKKKWYECQKDFDPEGFYEVKSRKIWKSSIFLSLSFVFFFLFIVGILFSTMRYYGVEIFIFFILGAAFAWVGIHCFKKRNDRLRFDRYGIHEHIYDFTSLNGVEYQDNFYDWKTVKSCTIKCSRKDCYFLHFKGFSDEKVGIVEITEYGRRNSIVHALNYYYSHRDGYKTGLFEKDLLVYKEADITPKDIFLFVIILGLLWAFIALILNTNHSSKSKEIVPQRLEFDVKQIQNVSLSYPDFKYLGGYKDDTIPGARKYYGRGRFTWTDGEVAEGFVDYLVVNYGRKYRPGQWAYTGGLNEYYHSILGNYRKVAGCMEYPNGDVIWSRFVKDEMYGVAVRYDATNHQYLIGNTLDLAPDGKAPTHTSCIAWNDSVSVFVPQELSVQDVLQSGYHTVTLAEEYVQRVDSLMNGFPDYQNHQTLLNRRVGPMIQKMMKDRSKITSLKKDNQPVSIQKIRESFRKHPEYALIELAVPHVYAYGTGEFLKVQYQTDSQRAHLRLRYVKARKEHPYQKAVTVSTSIPNRHFYFEILGNDYMTEYYFWRGHRGVTMEDILSYQIREYSISFGEIITSGSAYMFQAIGKRHYFGQGNLQLYNDREGFGYTEDIGQNFGCWAKYKDGQPSNLRMTWMKSWKNKSRIYFIEQSLLDKKNTVWHQLNDSIYTNIECVDSICKAIRIAEAAERSRNYAEDMADFTNHVNGYQSKYKTHFIKSILSLFLE